MSPLSVIMPWIFRAAALLCVLNLTDVLGCATCFGKSDSALAQGMNMGIFALLAVITMVLSGVAGFFVFLARQSAKCQARTAPAQSSELITRP